MKIHNTSNRRSAAQGFTLIELMVALMILGVGILALAGTSAIVSRLVSGGAQQTVAANVAASRFEILRSQKCAALAAGSAVTNGMNESWSVTASGTTGIRLVVDSVKYTAAKGRTPKPLVFQSLVRCS